MKPVIVGLDPGTTSAYAVISFDANVVKINSRRGFGLSQMISEIIDAGSPLIVGTDKKDIPSSIKEFSQKTGTKIITPRYDLKKGEKKTKVFKYRMLASVKNVHETDALASALYAFEQYRPLVKKINVFLKKNNKMELRDDIITLLIGEEGLSIRGATELLQRKPETAVEKQKHITSIALEKKRILTKKEKHILLLTNQNIKLQQRVNSLEKELDRLRDRKIDIDLETRKLLSFKENRIIFFSKEIERLKGQVESYQERLGSIREFILDVPESYVMKKLDNIGYEELLRKEKTFKVKKDDILLVGDISVYSEKSLEAIRDKAKAVVYREGRNRVLENSVLAIPAAELDIREIRDFALVKREDFDRAFEEHAKSRTAMSRMVKDIISDYQKERQKLG